MTIDASERNAILLELAHNLHVTAWALRDERCNFSAHILRTSAMLHVYTTLSRHAQTLEIMSETLTDVIFLEGIEMDKNTLQQRAAEEAQAETDDNLGVNSTDATSSKGQEATKPTEPAGDIPESRRQEITQDQHKQYASLAKQLASAITQSTREIARQKDLERVEKKFTGISAALERIDKKFAGIGKALDVIARAVQKNMAAGNNHDDQEQGG